MTMRIARTLVFAETLVSFAAIGCGNSTSVGAKSADTREPAGTTNDAEDAPRTPWEACYSSFSPAGEAESDLKRLVRDCGPIGGMKAVTPVRTARQSSEDPVDRY